MSRYKKTKITNLCCKSGFITSKLPKTICCQINSFLPEKRGCDYCMTKKYIKENPKMIEFLKNRATKLNYEFKNEPKKFYFEYESNDLSKCLSCKKVDLCNFHSWQRGFCDNCNWNRYTQ